MSLFPILNETKPTTATEEKLDWLENSSFKPGTSENVNVEISEVECLVKENKKSEPKTELRSKKKKKKDKQVTKRLINTSNEPFFTDINSDKLLLLIPFHAKGSAPKYSTKKSESKLNTPKKYKKVKRFYSVKVDNIIEKQDSETHLTTTNPDKTQWTAVKQEEDLRDKTAFYNRSLDTNPNDIDLWLKYIHFQDDVYRFEKMYKRGSNIKGSRVTAERKISILDKALTYNADCEAFHRERLLIAEQVYPADELAAMLKSLISKDPGNIIIWQGYIEATQCSMAHCNMPIVMEMYNKCLSNLHQFRRNSSSKTNNIASIEAKILNMLYQCSLFLRQAGLWEQVWTLLRLYLELNLSPENKSLFNPRSSYSENELVELEDIITSSNLPSHELWLRIEKLREACHWLPWNEQTQCADPQRLVFSEDVADLIHPITSMGNSFRLTAIIFTILKVPLLPSRHTTMHDLGLDYVPWALDALELLLPAFFPISTLTVANFDLLKNLTPLAVGPQYLKTQPGDEAYLDFVTQVMQNCARCLKDTDKHAIYLWWFSFERLIIICDKEKILKLSTNRKKKFKSIVKNMLQEECNRNNLFFYREYALLENEQQKFASACKILVTSIQAQTCASVFGVNDTIERTAICSLYKTLTELLINAGENIETIISVLISLVLEKPALFKIEQRFENTFNKSASHKFTVLTEQLLSEKHEQLTPAEQLLPDFCIDWITCNSWFIYLTDSAWAAGAFIEDIINNHFKGDAFRTECLFELYVAILYKQCTEKSGTYNLLNEVLARAINLYPNNFCFLSTLLHTENTNGGIGRPWWNITKILTTSNHCIPRLFLIILAHQRITIVEQAQQDSIITTGGPILEDSSSKNKMLALFQRLTSVDSVSKRCGLLWRLYLKFLYHRSSANVCRNAYYAACEECPWLKALYIDAAIYIPTELPQIQDLLIEKQLRLHLTPEELDVLRS